ncbi:MAG: glutamate--tRNA ligase family protein [Planctomycetota bacterium]
MTDPSPVITRFAPSPTGHLHIGGARTALFCWVFAQRAQREGGGGRFVLRVEDTDRARSSEDAAKGILEDLAWLGIDWDDGPEFLLRDTQRGDKQLGGDARGVGPFYQAQRLDTYIRFFDQLVERGLAYPAFDTPEELNAMRQAAQAEKRTFRYAQAPDYDRDAALARMQAEPHVLRLKMPADPITVHDEILGEVTFTDEHTDDFVIRKIDGFPTYHFAVVVDDELMGVTHVVRGQEHLNNTPKHVALQSLLQHDDGSAFCVPSYAHVPLIFNPDGSKMSKRDKDKAAREAAKAAGLSASPVEGLTDAALAKWIKDKKAQLDTAPLAALAEHLQVDLPAIEVADFKAAGYLPEVVCNFIELLGWNPGEKADDGKDLERFDADYLCSKFSFDRVGSSASKFDREKLSSFNAHTIQHELSDAEFATLWRVWLAEFEPGLIDQLGDRFALAAKATRPRTRTLCDAIEPLRFVLTPDDAIVYDEKAVAKGLIKGDPSGHALLEAFAPTLAHIDPYTPEAIEDAVKAFAESRGVGMGKLAAPLRVAITGTNVSPPLGETLALVGRDGVSARVARALAECAPAAS